MKRLKNIFTLLHAEVQKTSYFKQILFSYILISCITFLIFSIAILSIMQNEHDKSMQDLNQQNITQAYSFNTSVLQDISHYFQNSLNSVNVRKLLYSDEFDVTTALNSAETYNNFQKISSMILSMDFINFTTNTVLTKQERCSLERFADQDLLVLLQNLTPRTAPYFCYPREIPYRNGTSMETRRVISMIYYCYKNGALVVNLDYDTYCSSLNLNYGNDFFHVMLINQNDTVMASTDTDQFMNNATDIPLYQQILNKSESKGTFTYQDNSGKYAVAYHKSPQMGITYISTFALQNKLHGGTLFIVTLRYSIIYLIITLLLSFLTSYIISRPIKKLKKVIQPANSDATIESLHKNDFEFLESAYKQLIEKNTSLTRFKQNYTEEKQQKLLWMLMNNTGNLSVPRQDLEALDAYFEYLNYLVFIINIEIIPSKQDMDKDIQLCKFIIQNVTSELFEAQTNLKYVETMSSYMVFTGSFEYYNKQQLLETALHIQQFFHDTGLFRLSFGFGSPVTELENLAASYDAAKTALINGRLNNLDCVQFYDDLQLVPPSIQQYPYEAEQSILAALKAHSMEGCFSAINDFFVVIHNYHYSQIHRSLLQLDAALQRFEHINELPQPPSDIDTDMPLRELEVLLQQRCETNIQALIEIKTHSFAKTELISEVNAFIEDNIYNPNLSVAMIAEKVDLSINYLRNIYKENSGESLTTYIANRKLTLVCEMLSNTDTPIQDISNKLGFTTKNYFFTFFKKHMNMTPTQYRSLHSSSKAPSS